MNIRAAASVLYRTALVVAVCLTLGACANGGSSRGGAGGGGGATADRKRAQAEADARQAAQTHLDRGRELSRQNRYGEAIASFTRAIEADATLADAYCGRAVATFSTRPRQSNFWTRRRALPQHERAFADLGRAIELKPDYAEAMVARAAIMFDLSQFPSAIADCDRAARVRPDYAEAYFMRSCIYANAQDRHADAVRYCQKAIALEPQNPKYAQALAALEQKERGREQMEVIGALVFLGVVAAALDSGPVNSVPADGPVYGCTACIGSGRVTRQRVQNWGGPGPITYSESVTCDACGGRGRFN
jgi:tetratricopeptide (TPR) repeat protein